MMSASKDKGITLVELLLSIAIVSILAATTAPLGARFVQENSTRNARDIIVSYYHTARIYSLSARGGNSWGVKSQAQEIVLFSGDDYASRNSAWDQVYQLPSNLNITNQEMLFEKFTGTASPGTIELTNNGNIVHRVIIDEHGNITTE